MPLKRKLLFFPILAVGIIALVFAMHHRQPLSVKPAQNHARVVKAQLLEKQNIAPIIYGFGHVQPKFDWKAIAEVSGAIIYRHPLLEKGQTLAAGTEILTIDPLNYQLKLTQTQSDLKASQIALAQIDQTQRNTQQTLKIEKHRLVIIQKAFAREKNLRKKGLTSDTNVEQQQQQVLVQQKLVLDLENKLALVPDERRVAVTKVKVAKASVAEAQRLLTKTHIILPHDLQISDVDVQLHQVVNLQQTMVIAHQTDAMEVEAQFSIHDLQTLLNSLDQTVTNPSGGMTPLLSEVQSQIIFHSGDYQSHWRADVSRLSEEVQANQATMGVILDIKPQVALKATHQKVKPLIRGMFVQAKLVGHPQPQWVIPESALHGQQIYIMNNEHQLEIRTVKILYRQQQQVVIQGDLKDGEQLVLNDLLPAIEGMSLRLEASPLDTSRLDTSHLETSKGKVSSDQATTSEDKSS